MSCHGLHHACVCRQELEEDLVDALARTVQGIEKYIKSLSPHDQAGIYSRFDLGLKSARSVLRRARKI